MHCTRSSENYEFLIILSRSHTHASHHESLLTPHSSPARIVWKNLIKVNWMKMEIQRERDLRLRIVSGWIISVLSFKNSRSNTESSVVCIRSVDGHKIWIYNKETLLPARRDLCVFSSMAHVAILSSSCIKSSTRNPHFCAAFVSGV